MIRLWIKGSLEDAQAAAQERGIIIQDAKLGPSGQTICNVEDHSRYLAVVEWFNEDLPCVEGKGFPAGTLLLYA